jgi:hypothetical protein
MCRWLKPAAGMTSRCPSPAERARSGSSRRSGLIEVVAAVDRLQDGERAARIGCGPGIAGTAEDASDARDLVGTPFQSRQARSTSATVRREERKVGVDPVIGKKLNLIAVTIPNAPPPPRAPRTGRVVSRSTRENSPSAVTTLDGDDLVGGDAVLARQPRETAAQRVADNAHVG